MSDGTKFVAKVLKRVTRVHFKLVKDVGRYFRFTSEFYVGKPVAGDTKKEPPTLLDVVDLETGEEGFIIVPTVMHKELGEAYKSVSGKCFAVRIITPPEGKKYNLVELSEIGDPAAPAPVEAKAK